MSACAFVPVGLLDCVRFCVSLCVYVCICECALVCVRKRKHRERERESFDSTAFLSWRHLLPSPNLSVYQAKMLGKRLLRQQDNPCVNTHTHTHIRTFLHPPGIPLLSFPLKSQAIIYRAAHKHTETTNTLASSPTHHPSDTLAECCAIPRQCGRHTQRLKIWKGR